MVTFCSLPVALSCAATFRMPLASMSKVTSTCGTPRGAGGMPSSRKWPRVMLSRGHRALALQDVDVHRRLAVLGRARRSRLLARRDGGVALDQRGHHAAQGLEAQRQRGDVEQQHVLDLAGQHAGLDRGADGHHLVRVDALVRLLAGQLAHQLLHHRHAGRAADQHDLVDLAGLQPGVLERLPERGRAALDQVLGQLLELGAASAVMLQVLGAAGVGGDEGQVDLGLQRVEKLDLGLLGRLAQALQGLAVVAQVDALLAA